MAKPNPHRNLLMLLNLTTSAGQFMFHKICEETSDLHKYSKICKH